MIEKLPIIKFYKQQIENIFEFKNTTEEKTLSMLEIIANLNLEILEAILEEHSNN